jgi:hypothetical protein
VNFVNNLATVQFVHRAIAWTLIALIARVVDLGRSVPAPQA